MGFLHFRPFVALLKHVGFGRDRQLDKTHNAEQPMKITVLFITVQSVPNGALGLTGRGDASSAAFAALALELGMTAQSRPVHMVR